MDALQVFAVGILVCAGIASVLIFRRIIHSNIFPCSGNTESQGPSFLIAAIATVLFIPIALICIIGSLWLFMVGWEGFENTLMISIEAGLALGIFMAGFFYLVSVLGRRQERRIEEDMKKIEKTRRPLPAKYGKKVALAIPALLLVSVLFYLLMSNFSMDKLLWQRAFLYEAVYWFIFAFLPFIPSWRYQLSFRDPAAKWWLVTFMSVVAILVFLSVLLAYFF